MMRALRGATTVKNNTKDEIFAATIEMMNEIISLNNITPSDICDIIFTVTPDLTAVFPAAAVRKMGITDVPLLDMAAPDIDGALKKCIRVMVHINTDMDNKDLTHVYLKGAKALRPDLAGNTKKICVAIDGPAGAGKSSVAKKVAGNLGYVYIDTGAMYRTVAVWAIENGVDTKDTKTLISALDKIKIDISYEGDMQRMYLNGKDVTERIRKNDASMGASAVATIPEVRKYLVCMQQKMAEKGGVIMDGRDIATDVLPNAELKIFLTASVDERARRRYAEYIEKGIECDYDSIKADVIKRDENDMNREASPLRQAEDAVLLDTSEINFDQTVFTIEKMIKDTEAKS